MGFWEAAIVIVAITAIASIVKTRYRAMNGIVADEDGNERRAVDPDAVRLREEMKLLKDRIAVLERLATDNNRALDLDREIERLR